MRALAWTLGVGGAVACAATIVATLAIGFTDQPVALACGYGFGILMGLLGALIASREPGNGIGWLMCVTSIATSLTGLPTDYAYAALVIEHGSWPLGTQVLWFSSWSAIPIFSLLLPLILARFPDGRIQPRWRVVDWLAIAGTLSFGLSVALAPADIGLVTPAIAARLLPHAHNALGFSIPDSVLAYSWMGGLFTVLTTYVVAAASVAARFRRARGDERIQLKWFAYACVLVALASVYAGVAWDVGAMLGDALIPFEVVVVTLPVAIGIAILRYRLFDIDLIINRTLVYGTTTAVLAAAYAACITLFQRLFISLSGQRSDAAYVLTAFVIVVGFSPLKDWLQRRADRELGGGSATQALGQFRSRVDAVVSVFDPEQTACRLLDEAARAFNMCGAALYLRSSGISGPTYSLGHLNGGPTVEVPLRHRGRQLGHLVLGSRRGDADYSPQDLDALQQSADSVAGALVLSERFGVREAS